MDSYARRYLDARGSNQTAELLQANDSYITVPSHLAMRVAERRNKMKSPFRIRVQGPSGEFEVFEDDPTKVAEKVRELEKLRGRTATIVDADGKPVDRTRFGWD